MEALILNELTVILKFILLLNLFNIRSSHVSNQGFFIHLLYTVPFLRKLHKLMSFMGL